MPQQDTIDRAKQYASAYLNVQEGEDWQAPTGPTVRVRRLDLSDYATINQFPDKLRKMIFDAIDGGTKLNGGKSNTDTATDIFDGMNGEEKARSAYEISVTLVKIGWISPKVVDEPDRDAGEISIDDVRSADRQAYMQFVFGQTQQEAAKIAPFPERADPGVGTVRSVQDVQSDAVATVGNRATEVERSDSV